MEKNNWRLGDTDYMTFPFANGFDLRLMTASEGRAAFEIISEFRNHFESKKKDYAVLVVRAGDGVEKWTVSGFNDDEEFRTAVVDDPSHELAEQLKKDPINKRKVFELAASEIGRTLAIAVVDHLRTSKRRAHVREQIEQVLFTVPGERVFRPDFGAGVGALVFEPNSGALRQAIETRLVDSLAQALAGEVDPRSLAIKVEAEEEKLNITVTYQLAAIRENLSEVFSVGGSYA